MYRSFSRCPIVWNISAENATNIVVLDDFHYRSRIIRRVTKIGDGHSNLLYKKTINKGENALTDSIQAKHLIVIKKKCWAPVSDIGTGTVTKLQKEKSWLNEQKENVHEHRKPLSARLRIRERKNARIRLVSWAWVPDRNGFLFITPVREGMQRNNVTRKTTHNRSQNPIMTFLNFTL